MTRFSWVNTRVIKSHPEWRTARVTDFQKSDDDGSLRIELDVGGNKQWMDAHDEMLCPVGSQKSVNASTVATSPVSSYSLAASYRYGRGFEAGRSRTECEGVVESATRSPLRFDRHYSMYSKRISHIFSTSDPDLGPHEHNRLH
ncbi:hypothetical protein L915_08878 [Phytophthora nicotianae]|uniref:Uncharacterized protein n=1 Tax=Phytophthora nicotianae TaxID=4792 RepID=W2GW37_PHYNI|nr:hypothetical protein L915_08878 [Phytophthora nicotianae]